MQKILNLNIIIVKSPLLEGSAGGDMPVGRTSEKCEKRCVQKHEPETRHLINLDSVW